MNRLHASKIARLTFDAPLANRGTQLVLVLFAISLIYAFAHGFYRYLYDGQPEILIGAAIAAVLHLPSWLALYYLERRNRSPKLIWAFVIASMLFFFGPIVSQVNHLASGYVPTKFVVGFIEEFWKQAPLLCLVILVPRAVTTTRDGIVLGGLGGLGFSILEFGAYAALARGDVSFSQGIWDNLARVNLLGTGDHVLWSALIGASIGWAASTNGPVWRRILVPLGTYLAVAVNHSFQDSGGNILSTMLSGMIFEPFILMLDDPEGFMEANVTLMQMVFATTGMFFTNILVIPALLIAIRRSGDTQRRMLRDGLGRYVGDVITRVDYQGVLDDKRWGARTIANVQGAQSRQIVQLQNELIFQGIHNAKRGYPAELSSPPLRFTVEQIRVLDRKQGNFQ